MDLGEEPEKQDDEGSSGNGDAAADATSVTTENATKGSEGLKKRRSTKKSQEEDAVKDGKSPKKKASTKKSESGGVQGKKPTTKKKVKVSVGDAVVVEG